MNKKNNKHYPLKKVYIILQKIVLETFNFSAFKILKKGIYSYCGLHAYWIEIFVVDNFGIEKKEYLTM